MFEFNLRALAALDAGVRRRVASQGNQSGGYQLAFRRENFPAADNNKPNGLRPGPLLNRNLEPSISPKV